MNFLEDEGFFVPHSEIKKLGVRRAVLKNAFLVDAPLNKYQLREAKKMFPKKSYSEIELKNIVSKKTGKKTCEWCKDKCHLLEEHHYPVPRKLGGKEIVEICGKCHSDFHHLEKQ